MECKGDDSPEDVLKKLYGKQATVTEASMCEYMCILYVYNRSKMELPYVRTTMPLLDTTG